MSCKRTKQHCPHIVETQGKRAVKISRQFDIHYIIADKDPSFTNNYCTTYISGQHSTPTKNSRTSYPTSQNKIQRSDIIRAPDIMTTKKYIKNLKHSTEQLFLRNGICLYSEHSPLCSHCAQKYVALSKFVISPLLKISIVNALEMLTGIILIKTCMILFPLYHSISVIIQDNDSQVQLQSHSCLHLLEPL